jgi:hypothetical protein
VDGRPPGFKTGGKRLARDLVPLDESGSDTPYHRSVLKIDNLAGGRACTASLLKRGVGFLLPSLRGSCLIPSQ